MTDLCAWLGEQEASQPESRAEDAVTVMTYHGSKGLEWPFVDLIDLDDKPKGSAFGTHVVSDRSGDDIDWNDPLQGRWLRFWPWPFGGQKKQFVLDAAAANSDEGKGGARRSRGKGKVALCRRDPRPGLSGSGLTEIEVGLGVARRVDVRCRRPRVRGARCRETIVQVNENPHAVRVAAPVPNEETALAAPSTDFSGPYIEPVTFLPLALKPSDEAAIEDARIVEEIDLGHRLPFAGTPDMTSVGEAIHRFLAADDPAWDEIEGSPSQSACWRLRAWPPLILAMSSRWARASGTSLGSAGRARSCGARRRSSAASETARFQDASTSLSRRTRLSSRSTTRASRAADGSGPTKLISTPASCGFIAT